jgi:hypothetical protein
VAHVASVRSQAGSGGFVHLPVRSGHRHPFHLVVDKPIQLDRRADEDFSVGSRNNRNDRITCDSFTAGGAGDCSARRLPGFTVFGDM